jgi:hypothetical protein
VRSGADRVSGAGADRQLCSVRLPFRREHYRGQWPQTMEWRWTDATSTPSWSG